jgi:hypothetical protein
MLSPYLTPFSHTILAEKVVEVNGIEPMTFPLEKRDALSLSNSLLSYHLG